MMFESMSRRSGQRHDVLESEASNIATLRSNVAMFLRVDQNYFANVAMLQRANVSIFPQRHDVAT